MFKMILRTSATVTSLLMMMMIFSGHCLPCHRAEYEIRNECCPKCPAGSRVKTDCTEFKSTSCLVCLDQTFMDQPNGLKHCFPCTNCDPDSGLRIKSSCSSTSDTVCEPLHGFYCVDSKEGNCVRTNKHRVCEPGQFISENGTVSSDSVCSVCSDGTFSDGTFTVCRPHTQCDSQDLQLIKAGTHSSDAQCGEIKSHKTETVIVVIFIVVIVIVMFGAASHILYMRKRRNNLNQNTEQQNADSEQNECLNRGENVVNGSVQLEDKTD